jgi:hypothetical protein
MWLRASGACLIANCNEDMYVLINDLEYPVAF